MDVVRGSLREFGALLSVMTGGVPDGGDGEGGRPHRGAGWIVIQVVALAVLVGALFGVGELFIVAPEPGTVATSAAWFLPGFLLALPLATHWLARPARRVPGGSAAVPAGAVVAVAVAPVFAGMPGIWAGLLTLVPAALVAAAVFGAVAPVPARRP
ncbi:MAG: hypothetical protein L0I24_07885 [Pseudonocardia sp.]|nr:hypothetical protein [Pseudonocardia sp.]